MSFVYRTLKLCSFCYDSIKVMLVHQSNEQIRARRGGSNDKNSERVSQMNMVSDKKSKATFEERSPIKQGWMIQYSE